MVAAKSPPSASSSRCDAVQLRQPGAAALLDRGARDAAQAIERGGVERARRAFAVEEAEGAHAELGSLLDQPRRPAGARRRDQELESQARLARRRRGAEHDHGAAALDGGDLAVARSPATVDHAHGGSRRDPRGVEQVMVGLAVDHQLRAVEIGRLDQQGDAHAPASARSRHADHSPSIFSPTGARPTAPNRAISSRRSTVSAPE